MKMTTTEKAERLIQFKSKKWLASQVNGMSVNTLKSRLSDSQKWRPLEVEKIDGLYKVCAPVIYK